MTDHTNEKCSMKGCWSGIYWWAALIVAVLAVPSFGFVVASVVPGGDMGKIAVFIITCWVSTYLGMRLMKK